MHKDSPYILLNISNIYLNLHALTVAFWKYYGIIIFKGFNVLDLFYYFNYVGSETYGISIEYLLLPALNLYQMDFVVVILCSSLVLSQGLICYRLCK
jgi:hypothetical protein